MAANNVAQVYERNQDATCYVGNLDPKVDDELLWELMIQAGPLQSLSLPRDKITGILIFTFLPLNQIIKFRKWSDEKSLFRVILGQKVYMSKILGHANLTAF